VLIEVGGLLVQGVHHKEARTDIGPRDGDSFQCIAEQRPAVACSLLAMIQRQPCQQNRGNGLRAAATDRLVAGGAQLIAATKSTPWGSVNSRLESPDGVQLTLFSGEHTEA